MNLFKYRFTVSISSTHMPPMCKYPREHIITGFRKNKCIYEDNTLKSITYPLELLSLYVDDNDVVEKHIIELQNMWPNWYNINVAKIN